MPKSIDRERLTRFGLRVYEEMERKHITLGAITSELGIYPDHWRRMIYQSSPSTSIYVPMIFRLAQMLDISAVELLILVYQDQVIATDLTEAEMKLYSQLLKVFDCFYRLKDEDQDLAVSQLDNLLQSRGGKDLDSGQEKFLDKLRIHPIHEAGRGKLLEERMKKASAASTATDA
jgi:hypothetical protein